MSHLQASLQTLGFYFIQGRGEEHIWKVWGESSKVFSQLSMAKPHLTNSNLKQDPGISIFRVKDFLGSGESRLTKDFE